MSVFTEQQNTAADTAEDDRWGERNLHETQDKVLWAEEFGSQ
jgi:hypothetical protein